MKLFALLSLLVSTSALAQGSPEMEQFFKTVLDTEFAERRICDGQASGSAVMVSVAVAVPSYLSQRDLARSAYETSVRYFEAQKLGLEETITVHEKSIVSNGQSIEDLRKMEGTEDIIQVLEEEIRQSRERILSLRSELAKLVAPRSFFVQERVENSYSNVEFGMKAYELKGLGFAETLSVAHAKPKYWLDEREDSRDWKVTIFSQVDPLTPIARFTRDASVFFYNGTEIPLTCRDLK